MKKITSRKKFFGLIIFLLLTGGVLWRMLGGKNEKVQYRTAKVERGTIISSVSASGQVIASNVMEVNTQASGIVKKVNVKNGDRVKKGQVIAEITLDQVGAQKHAQAYSTYLSAKNNLESARASLYSLDSSMWAANQKFINDAVARGLAENDPTYIQEHDDWLAAEAKYKNQQQVVLQAQASLNSAWLTYQLSSPVVRAPMEGIIAGLSVFEGMVIGSTGADTGQKIAVIKTEGMPLVKTNLSEVDVSRVAVGQKATVVLDSVSDKTFTGKVVSVDKTGTVTNGVSQYPVLVQLDVSAEEILPNMAATVAIIIAKKEGALLVPSSAVQSQEDQSFVRVLKDGQVKQVPVEVGLSSDTQTEIVSGLSEGDLVVVDIISSPQSQKGTASPFSGSMRGMMRIPR